MPTLNKKIERNYKGIMLDMIITGCVSLPFITLGSIFNDGVVYHTGSALLAVSTAVCYYSGVKLRSIREGRKINLLDEIL